MTEDVTMCNCGLCWCLEPVSAVGDRLCDVCAAGIHQASRNVDRPLTAPAPKCRRHQWTVPTSCARCGKVQDAARVRAGRNSRTRGNRHELAASRIYGGRKVGPLGGPADIVGKVFAIQLKTHRTMPPKRLLDLFMAMDRGAGGRVPVVLDRYLRPGLPPIDLFVVRGPDWLSLHGRDGMEDE